MPSLAPNCPCLPRVPSDRLGCFITLLAAPSGQAGRLDAHNATTWLGRVPAPPCRSHSDGLGRWTRGVGSGSARSCPVIPHVRPATPRPNHNMAVSVKLGWHVGKAMPLWPTTGGLPNIQAPRAQETPPGDPETARPRRGRSPGPCYPRLGGGGPRGPPLPTPIQRGRTHQAGINPAILIMPSDINPSMIKPREHESPATRTKRALTPERYKSPSEHNPGELNSHVMPKSRKH